MKNQEEFINTIQENSGIIYKAAALYSSNAEDKEDLVQEIIYQLWKSYDSFQHHSSISTWMYRVAMNVSISYLKQSKKRLLTIPMNPEVLKIQSSVSNEEEAKWEKIHQQINTLSLLEKGIIMLYLENKSYKEIAEIIGISESNVSTRMARIKTKLKNKISNK